MTEKKMAAHEETATNIDQLPTADGSDHIGSSRTRGRCERERQRRA
jgi:hypothetical protein